MTVIALPTTMTAEEAFQSLAPKIGRPNDKEVKAKAFLMEMLKDGEMLSSDCEEKLEAAGFKKSTIKKAKKNTGVISRKKGFLWYWSLPMGDIATLYTLELKKLQIMCNIL